jgi:hypothetical protein
MAVHRRDIDHQRDAIFLNSHLDFDATDLLAAVLNGTLEGAFRRRYSGFRPANDKGTTAAAA